MNARSPRKHQVPGYAIGAAMPLDGSPKRCSLSYTDDGHEYGMICLRNTGRERGEREGPPHHTRHFSSRGTVHELSADRTGVGKPAAIGERGRTL